ncbi:MAG: aldo/keto reductase [Bacilli bacterium]|nr:aldo/keto reductase [Bacilli bacterium]
MIKFALGCDGPLFKEGKDVTSIMDAAIGNGVTIFDSARHYGESERVIGEYVRSHGKREDYFIISKGCHPEPNNRLNPIELRKDIEDSLRILNAGYIDLYFLHRDQFDADLSEILMVLNEYVAAGKIRAYGLSNWTLKRIKEFNNVARGLGCKECEAISNNFTLIPWENDPWGGGEGCVSFSSDKEAYEYLKETGIPLYSYSPLARGFLSGKIRSGDPETFEFLDSGAKRAYLSKKNLAKLDEIEAVAKRLNLTIPQLTLAYLSNLDINLIPAVSTSSPKRLVENILALSIKLVPEVMEELKRIALE